MIYRATSKIIRVQTSHGEHYEEYGRSHILARTYQRRRIDSYTLAKYELLEGLSADAKTHKFVSFYEVEIEPQWVTVISAQRNRPGEFSPKGAWMPWTGAEVSTLIVNPINNRDRRAWFMTPELGSSEEFESYTLTAVDGSKALQLASQQSLLAR